MCREAGHRDALGQQLQSSGLYWSQVRSEESVQIPTLGFFHSLVGAGEPHRLHSGFCLPFSIRFYLCSLSQGILGASSPYTLLNGYETSQHKLLVPLVSKTDTASNHNSQS